MTEHASPKDLLRGIKTRWQTVPDQQFKLPEDRILQRLLETCYHASFRTSEQRTVQCVVAYVSAADVPAGDLLLANPPVVLTDTELVRLSPVTQHRQTVIGCEQIAPDFSSMAEGMNWVSKVTAVALEMILPGVVGMWLDSQLETRFLTLLGFALGVPLGMWHLIAMTKSNRNEIQ